MYPALIRNEILAMGGLTVEIANRWILGWPKTVKAMIASGEYLEALKRQEAEEWDLFCRVDLRHLARHEICDLYGLTLMSPTPSVIEEQARLDFES